ncbi:MAG: UvrD-helicase domain-containing protein [Carbonactinosporaceae bacterium]
MSQVISAPGELAALLGVPFTGEQLAAITAPLAPGVIVAGAGSGKTTVMAARVVWLVGTGAVGPAEVLGLTFTNKAAGELAQRVRDALFTAGILGEGAPGEEPVGEPTISTYHAFAGRVVREHGLRIGVEPQSRLFTDATRFQLAARVLRTAKGPINTLTKPVPMLTHDLVMLDNELAEHLVPPDELRAFDRALVAAIEALDGPPKPVRAVAAAARKRIELAALVDDYRAAKHARDVLDFGDQMALAAVLAERRPEVGAVERDRFRVVLLDEYQDTSVAQRRMLSGLFGDSSGGAGRGHPLTAVGDPCQAIYGWRGASVANLDEFPAHFPGADGSPARRYTLSENRRSGGRLLAFANQLSGPLRARHRGVQPLRPRRGVEHLGRVRCALLQTYDEEIAWAADQVRDLVDAGVDAREIAILVRAGSDFPALHAALVTRDVPVEVVGLGGLLHLPEIADIVATLEVLDEPTSNAALVRLLTGPRWRIGPRDLVLLGRRARDLVHAPDRDPDGIPDRDPDAALEEAVAGVDPTEVVSLADALDSPGVQAPYSPAARERFARFAAEIRGLRRHIGEPLLDLLHRVVTVSGLDVELAASPHSLASRRRDTLAAFLDVAASFVDLDGDTSLTAFLAFLHASDRYDRGLDNTAPTGGDSVKLMTVHKAKGLEWDAVVVPALSVTVFPSEQVRPRWTSRGQVLPHDLRGDAASLPGVAEWSAAGLKHFAEQLKEQDLLEELRLGYVAFTRPRMLLVASGHWWGPSQKRPRGPSPYLEQLRAHAEAGHGDVRAWAVRPGDDETNPLLDRPDGHVWPRPLDPEGLARRRLAAGLVREAMAGALEAPARDDLTADERQQVASWDRDLRLLLDELVRNRSADRPVVLPRSLSASQLVTLAADADQLARQLARPMPSRPRPSARRGTRFHAWVESLFDQRPLLDPDDLPGAADAEIHDEGDLVELQEAFLRTAYAEAAPVAVEAPFRLVLGGRVIRGRIDAVYETDGGYEVVDWKTNQAQTADPLQLAIYRVAWADLRGVPLGRVSAAILYVRTGEVVRRTDLPDRNALARLLAG